MLGALRSPTKPPAKTDGSPGSWWRDVGGARCRLVLSPRCAAAGEEATATTTGTGTATLVRKPTPPSPDQHHDHRDHHPKQYGSVEVILGPMFAGKTTELLQRARGLRRRGLSVALVKPLDDDRYDAGDIVTHDGLRSSDDDGRVLHQGEAGAAATTAAVVHRLHRLLDLPRVLGQEQWALLDCVCVDEGQFFDDVAEFAAAASEGREGGGGGGTAAVVVRPKVVVVAGLCGDFRRRPFGRIAELLPLADKVDALRASCYSCGREAPFSLRLSAEEAAVVLVGGAEAYRPACRGCFERHQQQQQEQRR